MRQRTISIGKMLIMPLLAGGVSLAGGMLTGCAVPTSTTASCKLVNVMSPAAAVADHSAAPPGNSVTFDVGYGPAPGSSCALPTILYLPTLTSSDPVNVALSTPGLATCVGTTTVPAILTDTRSKATATLTCK